MDYSGSILSTLQENTINSYKCIYKGWIRDKAPPVSAVIDIHREL